MKTAKEWLEDMKAQPCVTEKDLLTYIEKIQKDASRVGEGHPDWLNEALNSGDGTYKP